MTKNNQHKNLIDPSKAFALDFRTHFRTRFRRRDADLKTKH